MITGEIKAKLLFVALFTRMLELGGRCASIVPDGVLFGTSAGHKAIRKELVDHQRLQAVISMPSGVFKPYAGVSTAILIFTKTNSGGTDKVWFYDMRADGFSLDDKRNPVSENDIRHIIEHGRQQAYAAASHAAIATYWNVGRRIVEEEQDGKARAEYGSQLIPMLAEQLTKEYGSGYNRRNLAYYRAFYLEFSDLAILHTRVQNLTWSHLRRIMSVSSPQAREWYLTAASQNMWSVRELDPCPTPLWPARL